MTRVPILALEYRSDGLYYLEGAPFTGVGFRLARDGWERSTIEYRDGLRWGASREWYAPGVPMVEATWFKDALHGRAREWHRNGQLAEDGEYEYGFALWAKQWDEAGALVHDARIDPASDAFARLERYRALYAEPLPLRPGG